MIESPVGRTILGSWSHRNRPFEERQERTFPSVTPGSRSFGMIVPASLSQKLRAGDDGLDETAKVFAVGSEFSTHLLDGRLV